MTIETPTTPTRRLRALLASVGALLLITVTAAAQSPGPAQVIPLRSGTYGYGGLDARVVLLASDGQTGLTEAKTAPVVLANDPDGAFSSIARDPLAGWIQLPSDPASGDRNAEFAIPFTVNAGTVTYADVGYMAGFDGVVVNGAAGELRMNGYVIGDVKHASTGVLDAPLHTVNIAPLLHSGVNWLTIGGSPVDSGARLIFSARVNIWRPTDAVDPPNAADIDLARSVGVTSSAVATSGVCIGFTCRPRGDLDSNHDVDLADHFGFIDCLSGPNAAAAVDCEYADMNCDGLVDLVDAGLFQAAFTGNP